MSRRNGTKERHSCHPGLLNLGSQPHSGYFQTVLIIDSGSEMRSLLRLSGP